MEYWLVLHTKPHQERQVAEQLLRHGLGVYLPLVWVNPVNPRSARERPYFPGYLFVKVALHSTRLELIRWAPGLKRIVEIDGQLALVSNSFIEELRRCLEQIRVVAGLTPEGRQYPARPKICDGPFAAGAAAFDVRLSGTRRSQHLMACVQHEVWRLRQTGNPPRWPLSSDEALPPASAAAD